MFIVLFSCLVCYVIVFCTFYLLVFTSSACGKVTFDECEFILWLSHHHLCSWSGCFQCIIKTDFSTWIGLYTHINISLWNTGYNCTFKLILWTLKCCNHIFAVKIWQPQLRFVYCKFHTLVFTVCLMIKHKIESNKYRLHGIQAISWGWICTLLNQISN